MCVNKLHAVVEDILTTVLPSAALQFCWLVTTVDSPG